MKGEYIIIGGVLLVLYYSWAQNRKSRGGGLKVGAEIAGEGEGEIKTWKDAFAQGKVIFEKAKRGKIDPKSLSAREKCIATFYQYSLDTTAKFNPEKGTPEEAITKCIKSI